MVPELLARGGGEVLKKRVDLFALLLTIRDPPSLRLHFRISVSQDGPRTEVRNGGVQIYGGLYNPRVGRVTRREVGSLHRCPRTLLS